MRLYFDFEFTGLHQHTTPISLGIVDENNHAFYAEFDDYDKSQVDEWLEQNVLAHLSLANGSRDWRSPKDVSLLRGLRSTRENVAQKLRTWLDGYDPVDTLEMWSDCLAYDWVLFCELFGGAMNLPKQVYYIPFDLCTALKLAGHDPDVSRQEFGGRDSGWEIRRHHALEDALDIKACHERLMREGQTSREQQIRQLLTEAQDDMDLVNAGFDARDEDTLRGTGQRVADAVDGLLLTLQKMQEVLR
jgi:hypothetical protein